MPKGNPNWIKGVTQPGQGRPTLKKGRLSERIIIAIAYETQQLVQKYHVNVSQVLRSALIEHVAKLERASELADWIAEMHGE